MLVANAVAVEWLGGDTIFGRNDKHIAIKWDSIRSVRISIQDDHHHDQSGITY